MIAHDTFSTVLSAPLYLRAFVEIYLDVLKNNCTSSNYYYLQHLGFELRVSQFLGRCSYHLSHSACPSL
jgi:hypothetical protein